MGISSAVRRKIKEYLENEAGNDDAKFNSILTGELSNIADYIISPSDDLPSILDGASSGEVAYLGPGTHDLDAAVTLSNGVSVRGAGQGATTVDVGNVGGDAITFQKNNEIRDFKITIPDVPDGDILTYDGADFPQGSRRAGPKISNVFVDGGNEAGSSAWALTMDNVIGFYIQDLNLECGINCWRIRNTEGDLNYGNSKADHVNMRLENDNITGLRVEGDTTTDNTSKNHNLTTFSYIDVITGTTTGCVGIDIENANKLTFIQPDIEKTDTAVQTVGGTNGGAAAASLTFINPYFDGAVSWGSDTIRPVVIGGQLTQAPTQAESGVNSRVAEYVGTEGPNGEITLDRLTEPIGVTGDGSTVNFDLPFSSALERGPSYYNVSLDGSTNHPDFQVNFATASKINVEFASAPADGASLDFNVIAIV